MSLVGLLKERSFTIIATVCCHRSCHRFDEGKAWCSGVGRAASAQEWARVRRGRRLTGPGEHLDRSGYIRMRAGVFVFVLGVDAVERIAASVVRAGRRADDHPQLVPRLEDERRRS